MTTFGHNAKLISDLHSLAVTRRGDPINTVKCGLVVKPCCQGKYPALGTNSVGCSTVWWIMRVCRDRKGLIVCRQWGSVETHVCLHHQSDDGWCEGVLSRRRGLFPDNFVQFSRGENPTIMTGEKGLPLDVPVKGSLRQTPYDASTTQGYSLSLSTFTWRDPHCLQLSPSCWLWPLWLSLSTRSVLQLPWLPTSTKCSLQTR